MMRTARIGSPGHRWRCFTLASDVPASVLACCNFLVSVVILAACGSDATQRSSVGTVANTPLRVEEYPRLSLGVIEGDSAQEFHMVLKPFLMSDGSLVVPLGRANSIRVFAPDGSHIKTLGQTGAGPGEFAYLAAVWPRGDTIEAFDFRLRRITRFLPDDVIETVTLRTELRDLSLLAGPVSNGWIFAGVASAGAGRRDTLVIHHFARDGLDQGELARVAGFARYETPDVRGPEPLSPRAVLAVHDDKLYIGDTSLPKIDIITPNGTKVGSIAWRSDETVPPEIALRNVIDSAVARASPAQAVVVRRRLEGAPVPSGLPAFWDIIIDASGFLWVRAFDPLENAAALGGLSRTGRNGRWSVFSPDGILRETVNMPSQLEPSQITANAVVGLSRDELGVEYVRLHTVHRR